MGVHGAHRIGVHPVHGQLRVQFQKLLLDLLGAGAQGFHRAAAFWAALGHRLGKAAVVAHQPAVGAVIGHRKGAAGALGGFPAVHAHKGTAVAPAVQKQHRLAAPLPVIINGFLEGRAEGKVVSQLHFLPHIHNFHLRQRAAIVAFFQGIQGIIPGFGPVHTLHAGGGGTQEHQGIFLHTPPDGHLPGGIPGRIFGFIGMLLLFVQDDDAKLTAGGEHRRAGAHDDPCLAGADPFPLVIPFPKTQAAVEHGHGIAEPGGHQPQ